MLCYCGNIDIILGVKSLYFKGKNLYNNISLIFRVFMKNIVQNAQGGWSRASMGLIGAHLQKKI